MKKPSNILNKKFEKTPVFGYKIDDVDDFFAQIAEEYERLCEENEILEQKLAVLANKIEEYRNDENSVSGVLIEAKKLGNSIVNKAKADAELIVKEARSRAEQTAADIRVRTAKEQASLKRIQMEVAGFKSKITGLYKSQLDMLGKLPEEPKEVGGLPQDLVGTADVAEEVAVGVPEEVEPALGLQMEKPDESEPVTKQVSLKKISKLEAEGIAERRFIDVSMNEQGDVVSKFGVLKFGKGHDVLPEKKNRGRSMPPR